MLTSLFSLLIGLAMAQAAQPAASGTIITANEIAATLKQSIANNVVDQPIKAADVPGGHKRRSRCCAGPEPRPARSSTTA